MIVNTVFAASSETYPLRLAIAGIIALSLGAAPIGVFLMLRRMSLMGDAMAHAMLPGVAIGYMLAGMNAFAMTAGGLIASFTVAIVSGVVARSTELREETSLASFYLVSLALGVAIVAMRGSDADLVHLLFGDVLAMNAATLVLIAVSTTLTLLLLAAIWRPLVMEIVDPQFLRSVSRTGAVAHMAFLALLTVNLVAGFLAFGTLLAVGMMVLPAAAARFWTRDLSAMVIIATVCAMGSGLAGLVLAIRAGYPPGPTIILTAAAILVLSLLFGRTGGVVRRLYPAQHLEA